MTAIDALKLGRGAATDYLGISFSALDKVGHDFGPDSHEVQDMLIHLDTQLGLLLDKLDRDVGKGNYVVGLTSDHGVAPVPERVKAQGFDAGRIDTGGGRQGDRQRAGARAWARHLPHARHLQRHLLQRRRLPEARRRTRRRWRPCST